MTFLTGTSSASMLEMLHQFAPPASVAVTGAGVVLFLQAVAYVLVILAALAVLLRFGLCGKKGQSGNCKCSSRDGQHTVGEQDEAHGGCCNGSASARQVHFHAAQDRSGHTSLKTNGSAHSREDEAPEDEVHHGEPRSLSRGRLPERCVLPPVAERSTAEDKTDVAATGIRAAISSPADAACAEVSTEEAEAEQRRITAVIAAAVHNALGGQPHRIVRIEPLNQSWAQEGRRDIFSSHRIR